jgi:hypothetical protein
MIGCLVRNGRWDLGGVSSQREADGVDGNTVGFMTAPELEMTVSFPGVVDGVPVCYLGEEGAGVRGERVEVQAVGCEDEELYLLVLSPENMFHALHML